MSTLYLDNFTGSGLLNAHTSDSGHTYSTDTASGDPAHSQLNGSGALVNFDLAIGGGAAVPSLSLPGSYSLLITAIIGNIGSVASGGYFWLYVLGGTPSIQMDAGSIYFSGAGSATLAKPANGSHTFQLDVTPTTRKWSMDGTVVSSVTGTTALSATTFDFQHYVGTASDYGAFLIDAMQITATAPPPPPPAFWTNLRGVFETP